MHKSILSLLICLFAIASLSAQIEPQPIVHPDTPREVKEGGPIMQFESTTVDYGTINKNSEPLRTLSFTNTGDEPLVIKSAKGSCGCTVPTFPREPIMPGESSVIEIRYSTNRLGKINKTVKITTNEGTQPHILKVVGNILDTQEEESVPKSAPSMLSGGN
ncbi:MAG: DUF1573 domain-containing protein [Saprospiraceae bacterium]|nr:DUF1573 domain-containing protein [Bacteroidia bacterium]MBT8230299.1 DUF1573 domain-containing protein [Bacteroidia bacterium]NNF20517.1 DUF1573 domain-containing protein [Saprospiraceae bacterium]NNK90110.1 DUF1573 domain-containing protein [Saprospiraceae bacterium]